ncbi:MAG: alpha/beta fold hydrolase [Candidatus Nealsonbacteria bacterium]|nr:alpha/beta fold hydrolase [Candidatus Nealsonbacteria bacterium]
MNRFFSPLSSLLAVTIMAAAGGCTSPLAEMMVTAPNRLNPYVTAANPLPPIECLVGVDEQFRVQVGPPEATLSVSIIEPSDSNRPKGTILVIHGILARSLWMLDTAKTLSNAGYRAVLVDLRGHGRSTGGLLTFGVQEARDLSQVIDTLEDRNLVDGPIGVYGISYGATTSIHLAGRDRRVKAVVAVAPFSTVRDEIPHFGRVMVPGIGWVIPEQTYQRAIDEAGRLARFDPDRDTALEAIRRTSAPVLLMHGTNDWVVPHRHSERLHAAAPGHSELVSVPWYGHTVIWIDPTSEVARRTRAWFDRWLTAPQI